MSPLDFEKNAKKRTVKKKAPMFDAAANTPDPLADVKYTGDIEKDSRTELDAIQTAYRDRAKREQKRFTDATDSEFWFAVCFRNRAAKDAFLKAAGLVQIGDKYLDGHAVARHLGVDISAAKD